MKIKSVLLFLLFAVISLLTACQGEKDTDSNTELMFATVPTQRDPNGEPRKPPRPEGFRSNKNERQDYVYNDKTKSWDFEYWYPDVRLVWEINSSKKMYIEYNGRREEVPWAAELSWNARPERKDFNGDGVDEFCFNYSMPSDYAVNVTFVYDIVNGIDLSMVYAVTDATSSPKFYVYPEYSAVIASYMNEQFAKHSDSGKVILTEDGSMGFNYQDTMNCYDDDGEEYEDRIRIRMYSMAGTTLRYDFHAYYVFGEDGCHIENMEMEFYE